jgi:hypothetical protein
MIIGIFLKSVEHEGGSSYIQVNMALIQTLLF